MNEKEVLGSSLSFEQKGPWVYFQLSLEDVVITAAASTEW